MLPRAWPFSMWRKAAAVSLNGNIRSMTGLMRPADHRCLKHSSHGCPAIDPTLYQRDRQQPVRSSFTLQVESRSRRVLRNATAIETRHQPGLPLEEFDDGR